MRQGGEGGVNLSLCNAAAKAGADEFAQLKICGAASFFLRFPLRKCSVN